MLSIMIWLNQSHYSPGILSQFIEQYTLTKKSLATLDGEMADPKTTVKLEMRYALIVHDEQT